MPDPILDLNQRCLIHMCLVLGDISITLMLVRHCVPILSSQAFDTYGTLLRDMFVHSPNTKTILLFDTNSHMPCESAMHSASNADRSIYTCFLELKRTGTPPSKEFLKYFNTEHIQFIF